MDIEWNPEEFEVVITRILSLSDNQIIRLVKLVGIVFKTPMKQIVAEMRESRDSIPMDVITSEASTKDDLLKWLSILEKEN